jgi:hypothetical protein
MKPPRKDSAEDDRELLKRQEFMYLMDQIRNRPVPEATPEQIERFKAAVNKARAEGGKPPLNLELDSHGMTPISNTLFQYAEPEPEPAAIEPPPMEE